MPITVEEYRVGQLYMIAKHSYEQSQKGEGVEVVENRPHEDPVHGPGQYTEKRIHLSSKLPSWIRSMLPKIFYVTEKAWNYYPFTVTEYSCSFLPRFSVHILTKYENNAGSTLNCLDLSEEVLKQRAVDYIDIALDESSPHHYRLEEDVTNFQSKKTGRGPLLAGWRETTNPIMCSYKVVEVRFDMVYMLQARIEEFVHKSIREILLVGHRQAFAWLDDWFEMSLEDVRDFEKRMQEETNEKVGQLCTSEPSTPEPLEPEAGASTPEPIEQEAGGSTPSFFTPPSSPRSETAPATSPPPVPNLAAGRKKSWFSWS